MGKLEEVRALLERDKGNWPETAAATGVSRDWIAKFYADKIGEPGFLKIERLYCYLRAKYQNRPEVAA